ncbi:DUF6776 family protein [Marinimicrobium alkaliphilum]|uniref:DUF6776 family protein n=1 Tax=Marinimicrobium alkaliphilum TaxID=2202654 RepID=UPI000DBA893A|nr:DUF6776 family protein [Marinimicrobium alkaliphilum]
MSVVKGSKPERLVVVRYRPWQRILWGSVAAVVVVAAVVGSYAGGHYQSAREQSNAVAERDRLRVENRRLQETVNELRQVEANLTLGSKVDNRATEELRHQAMDLKAQIASLEEDITFYRGLMEPSENRGGLTIGSLNVLSTNNAREYGYKLVVQQLATNHQVLNGALNFTVIGRQNGELLELPLYELSGDVESEDIRLRFRYFQNIEGRLTLPEGFEPERIELVARSTGQGATTVEKKFGWLAEEN